VIADPSDRMMNIPPPALPSGGYPEKRISEPSLDQSG
jgi:hypothetical protein